MCWDTGEGGPFYSPNPIPLTPVPTTNSTNQVTAPGVRVHTNEGTGDVEVDAWGFHLVCRKDPKTGKTRCRTRNEWWCVCCALCVVCA